MALDAKAIKEEIPDKDTYETSARKVKGKIYDHGLLFLAPRTTGVDPWWKCAVLYLSGALGNFLMGFAKFNVKFVSIMRTI